MKLVAGAFVVLALVAVPRAIASEQHPTSLEIQQELWCTDCQEPLSDANGTSFYAKMLSFIDSRVAAGERKSEIKQQVVAKFRGHVELISATKVPQRASLADLEGEVMCPVCNTTLDQSSSAEARQIEAFISRRIAAGDTKQQIEDKLVADYGPQILAAPPTKGFDLLAWLLPIAGLLIGALAVGGLAWRWSRRREPVPAAVRLDPALERRVDDELARFEES